MRVRPYGAGPGAAPERALKFQAGGAFEQVLRRRVAAHFQAPGRRRRDCPATYAKTAVLFAAFAASYGLLVFAAVAWWQGGLLAALLGLVAAGIGFGVQHDGGHRAYSGARVVNALAAISLELLGGSSYLWRWKHNVFHHAYVNVEGHDTDIDLGYLARLSPSQPRRRYHRWQHLYLWGLYAFLVLKWQLVGDFRCLATGRIGRHRVPRPRRADLLLFVGGKAAFFSVAFGIPLLVHSPGAVLACYLVATMVAGFVLSVVFQAAHCVGEATFPEPAADTGRIERAWAVHQVETTVDFARDSRVVTWLLGGLNFQIEHHLFPGINHANYPALSKVVEETCRQFGVRYVAHRSLRAGVASHFRWLRRMGRPEPPMRPSGAAAARSA